jgi:hypothetical protein
MRPIKYALFLLPLTCSVAYGQSYYVRKAIERKYQEKYEREHGDSGRAKLNNWVDNVNDVKLRPAYSFTRSVTYQTTNYRHGKPQKERTLMMYANPKEKLTCMKSEGGRDEMFVVMDIVPRAQLMFNNEKMEVMVINSNAFLSKKTQNSIDHPESRGDGKYNRPKEIGHKTILGYKCTGYETDNEAGEKLSEIWVAPGKDFEGFGLMNPALAGQNGVLVLEQSSYRNGELMSSMVATAVNTDEHLTFKTSDYQVKQMPHMR